jgi:hypothetical protein
METLRAGQLELLTVAIVVAEMESHAGLKMEY